MNISPKTSKVLVILIPLVIIVAASILVTNNFAGKFKFQKQTRKSKIIEVKKDALLSDEKRFNEVMIDFYSMADMARGIFPIDTTLAGREKAMSDIKDIGIYYWNRNLEVLDSAKKYNDNAEIRRKIAIYQDYCKLHISCYELMYKAIDKHTQAYNTEIAKRFASIDEKTKEIRGE
jgi:rhomboid protease GluP